MRLARRPAANDLEAAAREHAKYNPVHTLCLHMPKPTHERRTINGLSIFTRLSASPDIAGTPIVLVHGLSVSSKSVVPTMEKLASQRPVYAPDLPGFGESEDPRTPPQVPALAASLLAWMDAYALDRPVLLGTSLGTQVVAELAARHPHRAERLVLVAPIMDAAARTMPRQIWRLLLDLPQESLRSVMTQGLDYFHAGPWRTFAALRAGLDHHLEDVLPQLPMPVLIARGENDPVSPQPWCQLLASRCITPRAVAVIRNAPHAAAFDAPAALARQVLAFCEEPG